MSKLDLKKNHSSAEPPSYDSLFGRIRDTHKASRNVIDFVVKVRILQTDFSLPPFNKSLLHEKHQHLIDLVRDGIWERNLHNYGHSKGGGGRGKALKEINVHNCADSPP